MCGGGQACEEWRGEAERDRLYRQIGKLRVEVDSLKRNDLTSRLKGAERRRCIYPSHPGLSTKRRCERIGLPRPSDCRDRAGGEDTAANLERSRVIDEEYTRHPFYGSRQISNCPRRLGHKVNLLLAELIRIGGWDCGFMNTSRAKSWGCPLNRVNSSASPPKGCSSMRCAISKVPLRSPPLHDHTASCAL